MTGERILVRIWCTRCAAASGMPRSRDAARLEIRRRKRHSTLCYSKSATLNHPNSFIPEPTRDHPEGQEVK